jgi:tetratricopeptide (TPR) repeat protein
LPWQKETGDGGQGTEGQQLKDLLSRTDLREYADWLTAARRGDDAVKSRVAAVDRWADGVLETWYAKARKKEPHFAEALDAARRMSPDAPIKLRELLANRNQPAVARATAALELAAYVEPNNEVAEALRKALADRDPQIRSAAVLSLQQEASDTTVSALVPLLGDSTRLVRTETARSLALMSADRLRGDEREAFKKALDECFEAAVVDNDRAAGHMSLGILYDNLGQLQRAEEAYKTALRVEPSGIGARTNLAALYDRQFQEAQQRATQFAQQGNRAAAEKEIAAIADLPEKIDDLRTEELGLLERDALLAPDNAALQGRIGLARYLAGWMKEADSALLIASLLEPRNPEHLFRLSIYYRDTGRASLAAPLAARLLRLRPGIRLFQQFAEELGQQTRDAVPEPPSSRGP